MCRWTRPAGVSFTWKAPKTTPQMPPTSTATPRDACSHNHQGVNSCNEADADFNEKCAANATDERRNAHGNVQTQPPGRDLLHQEGLALSFVM